MKILLSFLLIVALFVSSEAAPKRNKAEREASKVMIVYKSGTSTIIQYDSGTIVNIDNDFKKVKPSDPPQQYNYSMINPARSGKLTVDLREVVAITIEDPR